ncbi:MAG: methyltransferase domain-containing protein [Notoacmeibacter sp.]|nr:methyltransferase domain-containing protein [Notoacmeibacter sp.]MCC0033360.1 methyltransferase domain-containing protein [Brucellaceae bacterium]
MALSSFSSGNPLADRRSEYAAMLLEAGDTAAAAELMAQALDLAPGWAAGWFRLGEMREEAGDRDGAVEAWRTVLRLDGADPFGATLKLGLAGAAPDMATMPPAFVEALFDQYAGDFDTALVERLDYRAPELLKAALAAVAGGPFRSMMDLGCGTGLMGERMRRDVSFLAGVDLSGEMLRQASAKGVYDLLDHADINAMPPLEGEKPDLVTAADVFMYLGDLTAAFRWVAGSLASGGLFGFTVEHHAGEGDVHLKPSRRYAHTRHHVEAQLAAFGFEILSVDAAEIRKDRGEPVEALIVIARLAECRAAEVQTGHGQLAEDLAGLTPCSIH